MASPRTLHGAALLGRAVVSDARVTIEGGRITTLGAGPRSWGDEPLPADLLLAPGFVDVHVHGGFGADAAEGADGMQVMARGLARRGVTAFLPTAVSAPLEELERFVGAVRSLGSRPGPDAARVLGANLEGPALDPAHAGAQPSGALVPPAVVADALRTNPAAWRGVRIMTLAPELPAAASLIWILASARVAPSLGHSGASLEAARAAYAAGSLSTTHLFNAMSGMDHRAPGLAAAALLDRRAFVELIADGLHVDPGLWPLVWRLVGRRLLFVSDGMAAVGMPDGRYELGGEPVIVADGAARRPAGRLAGSTITVADAVVNSVAAGLPLLRALDAVTAAPARLLRERGIGRIRRRALADLVLVDADGRVRRTMIGGSWLDELSAAR